MDQDAAVLTLANGRTARIHDLVGALVFGSDEAFRRLEAVGFSTEEKIEILSRFRDIWEDVCAEQSGKART